MTPMAICFMVLAIGLFWGGLAYSILRLRRHPELPPEADRPGHRPSG